MGRASNTPTKLLAYDEFLQTEGSLSGKTLQVGGTWSGAGDAADFTVIAADDVARRTATSDADANTGRYALAGSSEYATSIAKVSVQVSGINVGSELLRSGVLLRYVDTENWLLAYVTYTASLSAPYGIVYLRVAKRVAGTVTQLGSSTLALGYSALVNYYTTSGFTVEGAAFPDGSWSASAYPATAQAPSSPVLSGNDAALAVGGAIDEGKNGFYDAWTAASASTRSYRDFACMGADPPAVVCYSGKSIEFNSQGVLREDEAGEAWGQPDLPRGANFYLEPEGADGRINRIVLRMRRNDIAVEPDSHVEDTHTVEVKVRERFLLPR